MVFYREKIGCKLVKDPSSNMIVVTEISPGSEAEERGVEIGDMITAINYIDVHSHEETLDALKSSGRPFSIR